MKGYISHNGTKIDRVTILESIIVNPRKLGRLVQALTALNLTIDPSVQITDRKTSWIK